MYPFYLGPLYAPTQPCDGVTMTKAVVVTNDQSPVASPTVPTLATEQSFTYRIEVVRSGTAGDGPYTFTDKLPTGFTFGTGAVTVTGNVLSPPVSCTTTAPAGATPGTVTCTFTFSGGNTATINIPAKTSSSTGTGIGNTAELRLSSAVSTSPPCKTATATVNVVRHLKLKLQS